jgi:hypothetical protein
VQKYDIVLPHFDGSIPVRRHHMNQLDMKLFYKLMRAISYEFGRLCGMCLKCCFFIFAISADKKRLFIVTIALLPIAFVLLFFVMFLMSISVLFGLFGYYGLSIYGVLQEVGISITDRAHRPQRLLAWTDIKEFRRVFTPPGYTIQAILRSGEVVTIDEIDLGALATALQQRSIPFIGRDKTIYN